MSAIPADRAFSAVELEVHRIRELLQQRRYAEASAAAQALVRHVPDNRDVLLLQARSQRFRGQIAPALDTLQRLEQLHPGFSRLYQELGHCWGAPS